MKKSFNLVKNILDMNSEFMFQIKTINDELHTILTLKEFNVSIETFFNELQKVKYRIKSKIKYRFCR